jgi:very-short-patch-repair endonuclease
LLRHLFNEYPDLWRLSGVTHQEVRSQFASLDKSVINLNQLDIAHRASRRPIPAGVRGAVVKDTTELALVNHEITKQRKHIPIRQLMLRAGRAIQGLKPCFMMSPMSVAQFLAPGRLAFDLVVMDEASQLRPEDALGAVVRGTQLVVVGDPKQLPPTSFFQRALDDEADESDEVSAVAESESILDIALGRYQPVRRLRWHYRSQHHSLIAFSNSEFYDENLIVFPSAYHDHPELGVKYIDAKGVYENRRNALEAERVVEAILEHILLYPADSLGVVTMNFEQRELIEELLDARLKQDSFSSSWVDQMESTPEPFFVKNLENVQGDERDVIFISITYGPDVQGSYFQRFSGVNTASGQRRLNVLITRAKKRTVLFSSLDPDMIRADANTPWGVRALKGYLHFAKNGISTTPQISPSAEPSNEHEAAVGAVLKEQGYDVVPQVGVSGYFIDLAVRHPEKPGAFLLGIEFDGKSYHSGRSARDRDRLREMTLVNQGWKIHRIWSTDWFKNRNSEVERLLQRVRSLEFVGHPN